MRVVLVSLLATACGGDSGASPDAGDIADAAELDAPSDGNEEPFCYSAPRLFGIGAVNAIEVDAQGRILAAAAAGMPSMFHVSRYTATGELDTTFGNQGVVQVSRGLQSEAQHLALEPDGRMFAGGLSLDTSGAGGIEAAIDGDGQVLATRFLDAPVQEIFLRGELRVVEHGGLMYRYRRDGTTDASFGSSGVMMTDNRKVAALPDGRLALVGTVTRGSTMRWTLSLYTADGQLDASFNGGVAVELPAGTPGGGLRSVFDDGGRLLVVASIRETSQSPIDLVFARFDNDGTLDTTFASNGYRIVSTAPVTDQHTILRTADGRMVIGGSEATDDGRHAAMIRIASDGTLDPTFGTGGVVRAAAGARFPQIRDVALTSDRIIAGGTSDERQLLLCARR